MNHELRAPWDDKVGQSLGKHAVGPWLHFQSKNGLGGAPDRLYRRRCLYAGRHDQV